jgi:PhnB protein
MRNPPPGYQTVSPYLLYEDASRVVEHLKAAYGFEERLSQAGGAGRTHYELVLGEDGLVMIGQASDTFSSPRTLGIDPPSLVHVYVDDVDALHERARAAGADTTEIEMSPVGDRRFTATDPEGQVWVFAQRVADQAR